MLRKAPPPIEVTNMMGGVIIVSRAAFTTEIPPRGILPTNITSGHLGVLDYVTDIACISVVLAIYPAIIRSCWRTNAHG